MERNEHSWDNFTIAINNLVEMHTMDHQAINKGNLVSQIVQYLIWFFVFYVVVFFQFIFQNSANNQRPSGNQGTGGSDPHGGQPSQSQGNIYISKLCHTTAYLNALMERSIRNLKLTSYLLWKKKNLVADAISIFVEWEHDIGVLFWIIVFD